MLMWYIIFVLLILFTGGGLLYLGTRAAKFVPTGSTPKRRLLIGLSAVILIFAVIAWLINLMNAVICLLHFVFLWLVCDFIFTLVRRFRKRPFKRYYAGYAATALSLAALAAGWYLNHRVWVTAYTIESEKAISDLRIVLFADSHIGTTFDGEGFAKHVRAMQEQNPDLVVIAGDNDQIGILFLHGSDMFGKAFAVKGRSDVRIGKQDNPQVADCFFAFYRVGGNPYPVIQIPAGCKRGKAERCGGIAGIIAFKRPFAKTADEGENKIADKPEKNEMQQTDDRVHQVYQPGNDGKYQYDRGQPDQQPAFGSAAGGDEFGCAGAEVQQPAAGEKNQQNKYYIPHQHVVFSVLLSFF